MLAGAGTGRPRRALTGAASRICCASRAPPERDPGGDLHQQGRARDEGAGGPLLGEAVEGMPWLGTFHSVSARILRRHAELVGLKPNFTILDTDDQVRLLKQLILAANIDEKRWPARSAGRADRPLEEPRLDARDGACCRGRGLQQPGRAALRCIPGAASQPQRRRFRRPAPALRDDLPEARRTCLTSTSAGSATSLWTNTRTRTSPSICGSASGGRPPQHLLRGR
jgi:hypothetical protein